MTRWVCRFDRVGHRAHCGPPPVCFLTTRCRTMPRRFSVTRKLSAAYCATCHVVLNSPDIGPLSCRVHGVTCDTIGRPALPYRVALCGPCRVDLYPMWAATCHGCAVSRRRLALCLQAFLQYVCRPLPTNRLPHSGHWRSLVVSATRPRFRVVAGDLPVTPLV